jgi:AraC-like DNA-binding protein
MNAQLTSVTIPNDNYGGYFAEAAARLAEAASLVRDGYSEAAQAHVARALALLRGDRSSIPGIVPPPNGCAGEVVRGGLAAWQKRRLTAYIDAHLDGRIPIEDLAGLLKLSTGHFSRAFRFTFGTTAHEYLSRRRIEVAQSLMLTSREPLSAIALRCGLCDQSHFTRVFRRIVGETPHAWRRMRWGELEDRSTEPSRNPIDPPGVSILSSHAESDYCAATLRPHVDPTECSCRWPPVAGEESRR